MAADPSKLGSTPEEEQAPVSFSVMPHGDYGKDTEANIPTPPPAPEFIDPTPAPSAHEVAEEFHAENSGGLPVEHDAPGFWQRKSTYWVLGFLILGGLAAGAYALLGPDLFKKEPELPASRLPSAFLQEHFSVTVCADQNTCGDNADPEQDGLSNYEEFLESTDPNSNDTDEDGLADGDEINIYDIDPADKYTDKRQAVIDNDYQDGVQVKNEYDPLTPGIKMTEARKAQVAENIVKFSLHEPTITTLASAQVVVPQAVSVTVFINSTGFDAASVEINVNDTVVWLNRDTADHQIASDPHPAHTILPELNSSALSNNQTFSYKFTEIGTYTYHDELKPTLKGTIIVK